MKKRKKTKIAVSLMIVGLALITAAGGLFIYNRISDKRAGETAERIADSFTDAFKENENTDEPLVYIDGVAYIGYVSIPSLEIKLPVQADWSMKKLKVSPCRYTGHAYDGSLIICAHNYQSHFGKLKYLSAGEKIVFTDCLGKEYVYRIDSSDLIGAYDIEKMKLNDGWDLTLFTCTYGGRQRVTLRCVLESENDDRKAQ